MAKLDMVKGSLSIIILHLLQQEGKMYGYQMTKKVREITQDKMQITEAALYPTLQKLEKDKIIQSESVIEDGRMRKYYSIINPSIANEKLHQWQEMIALVQQVLHTSIAY